MDIIKALAPGKNTIVPLAPASSLPNLHRKDDFINDQYHTRIGQA